MCEQRSTIEVKTKKQNKKKNTKTSYQLDFY